MQAASSGNDGNGNHATSGQNGGGGREPNLAGLSKEEQLETLRQAFRQEQADKEAAQSKALVSCESS